MSPSLFVYGWHFYIFRMFIYRQLSHQPPESDSDQQTDEDEADEDNDGNDSDSDNVVDVPLMKRQRDVNGFPSSDCCDGDMDEEGSDGSLEEIVDKFGNTVGWRKRSNDNQSDDNEGLNEKEEDDEIGKACDVHTDSKVADVAT